MFEKILLPLDGSDLAEEVVPYGEEMAAKLGAELVLFHVCDESHQMAHNMHRHYLERLAEISRRKLGKNKVSALHLFGDFIQTISDYCETNNIGLVIMVAHGFTSLRVKVMGSIVDKVFRLLNCPSMLVQTGDAHRRGAKKALLQRILLPLDGSEYSETAIPYGVELGSKLGADLVLYTMARRSHMVTSSSDIIGETGMNDEAVNAAEVKHSHSYLKGVAEKLNNKGFNVDIMVSLDDDQGNAITRACQEASADLVVMATRGRQPITAWAPGSVAHKLLNKGDLPLLIVS